MNQSDGSARSRTRDRNACRKRSNMRSVFAECFADLFAPDALAEAPIAAVVAGGHVVAGTVDRLLVTEVRILVVDFKTGRLVPRDPDDVPPHHLRQMAAYVAALRVVFPGRAIEAALLYTAGPRLVALPPAVLAAHEPGLAAP